MKTSSQVSRRRILGVAIAAVAALPIAACGAQVSAPGSQSSQAATPAPAAATAAPAKAEAAAPTVAAQPTAAPSSGPQSITVWSWTSIEGWPQWLEAGKSFSAKYPDIKLNMQHVPSDSYWEKVSVGYAGNVAPDIVYLPPVNCHDLGAKGALLDLTPFAKESNFDFSNITPSTQQPYQWGGKVFAINAMNDTTFTVYNTDLLQASGVTGLPLPQDWNTTAFSTDRFLEVANKVTNPAKQQWGYAIPAEDLHWVYLFGGKLWDDDSYPTACVLNSAEAIAGLKFMQDLIYTHKVAPSPAEMSGLGGSSAIGPTDDIFKTGKVGMVWGRNKNLATIFKPITAFKFSATAFPQAGSSPLRTDIGINAFGTISKSKAPEAAWKWIEWMTAGPGNATIMGYVSLPANKLVDPYKVSPLPKWQVKLTLDGLPNAWNPAPHPNVRPEMFTAINAVIDELLLNKKTPEQVGAEATSKVNAIFKQLGPAVPK